MTTGNNRLALLGIPVDNINMDEATSNIIEMTEAYKHDQRKRLVATANVDFIINTNRKKDKSGSAKLLSILRNADMVTADGMPLVWLSKLIGSPLKERVTGADMVPALAAKAAASGKSIYLLGGKESSAESTAEILKAENPALKIAGYSAPMINLDDVRENKNIIARINISKPDILLIALGNPKQELWFDTYREYLRVPVSIGIGGTFEFISGLTARAPHWIQKSGLEWIYRMLQDPKRLIKRYAAGLIKFNLMVLPLLIMEQITSLFNRKEAVKSRNILPFFHRSAQKFTVAWKDTNTSAGIGLVYSQLSTQGTVSIDFKQSKNFSALDLAYLLNLLTTAVKLEIQLNLLNLRLIHKLQLRVNRLFDLVQAASKPALAVTSTNSLKKTA